MSTTTPDLIQSIRDRLKKLDDEDRARASEKKRLKAALGELDARAKPRGRRKATAETTAAE